jgi:4-aminobutyrate aminotransferase
VRASCDRHGALLIFDEVPSCLGRTGTMFVCEQVGAVPDMLLLGKGLGGGIMPMAALIARPELDVAANRALGHYTHEKSPVGCAAALTTLAVIDEEGLLAAARTIGTHALERLKAAAGHHDLIGDVRGMGLYLGVEIGRRGEPAAQAAAERIMYRCLQRGLSFKVGGGNIVTLCPPLTISRADLDRALRILEGAIADEAQADRQTSAG